MELKAHSLNRGTWSVTKNLNQSRTGGLILGLRAILQENGGAWSVTKYLTLSQLMQPRAEAPLISYQVITISPRPSMGT